MSKVTKTYDNNLLLKDAGLIASSQACKVGGAAKILDIGSGAMEGDVIIDVTACEIASNDESYQIGVQVSSDSAFASDYYEVASLSIGALEIIPGDIDMETGRYVIRFRNTIAENVTKRYLRLYVTVVGTISTGINFVAYLAKR
jgi:hypothetical protein